MKAEFLLIFAFASIVSVFGLITSDPSNFAIRHFPEPDTMSAKCNTFDEAHYCKMITLDVSLNNVAESHKCECPANFRCPADSDDTRLEVRCIYDEERRWNRCYLPCTPVDL